MEESLITLTVCDSFNILDGGGGSHRDSGGVRMGLESFETQQRIKRGKEVRLPSILQSKCLEQHHRALRRLSSQLVIEMDSSRRSFILTRVVNARWGKNGQRCQRKTPFR